MGIITYVNNSPNNKIYKELIQISILTGNIRETSSFITPTIRIEATEINFNYIYISALSRYYYVVNVIYVRNGIFDIMLKCDVLMSYSNEIMENTVIIDRSESIETDNYLSMNEWITKVKTKTDIIQFPNGFNNDGEYILITAGGLV